MKSSNSNERQARPGKIKMSFNDFCENELPLLADVISFCNNLPMSLYADTTVVKSPEVTFRGSMLSRTQHLAEEYLLNFKKSEADMGVLIGTNNYSLPMVVGAVANRDLEEDNENQVQLPPPQNERAPIGPVLRSRRSMRNYSGKAVSLQELSTLLAHSAGITGTLHLENAPESVALGHTTSVDLRAAASGGGLYPVDIFLVAFNVGHLPPGAYRYLPKQHSLKLAGSAKPIPELRRLAQFIDIQVERAAFLICYLYNFFENSRKYGESGLAFAFIETGAIAAHVHLLCTALGLGSCDVGGFSKRRFEHLFGADGISRHMIHLTVIGKPGEHA